MKMILSDCNVVCAAGTKTDLLDGLYKKPKYSMQQDDKLLKEINGWFGICELMEEGDSSSVSRTCKFLRTLVDQMSNTMDLIRSNYDSSRIATIIGTTTSGIREVEAQDCIKNINYTEHQILSAVSENLAAYCGFKGPNLVVSTACTSGAKALGLGKQLLNSGWCDVVVVGASESLNRLTCQGFEALESYSSGLTRPFQGDRDGINIGEGAALFVLEKGESGIVFSGFGESSDAFHESAPDPEGVGAKNAIGIALQDANLDFKDIDYINLHGTGTRLNDEMEANVVNELFGSATPVSSTKTVMGHTLGAAGAIEAAILWYLLEKNEPVKLPPHHGAETYDSKLPKLNLVNVRDNERHQIKNALSTSFAFGGHNTAIVLSKWEN